MHDLTPSAFADFLRREGIRRGFIIWDERQGVLRPSHPSLEPLAKRLVEEPDFHHHEGFFFQLAPTTGVFQAAFVHRTCRGQGAGGLRYWSYDTIGDLIRDGLRLARGMTHKNALAGLWWGGGKGVMARGTGAEDRTPEMRRRIFEEYGEFVTSLAGVYITAEDVGTRPEDMAAIFGKTRFVTCIPPAVGGSGNPSAPTARGVVRGIEAALAHRGLGKIQGKSVAVQGLGHVGEALIGYLRERGVARILGADVDPTRAARIVQAYPDLDLDLRVVERGDNSILESPVDVLGPCATGGVLNEETIPTIRAPIVCGAANNQLGDPERDDVRLADRGILYLPDFLVNRMGIVNCADEQYGSLPGDPRIERHLGDEWDNSVYNLSLSVLERARETGKTPARIALDLAEERSFEKHPLWGHRGADIIESLAWSGWAG